VVSIDLGVWVEGLGFVAGPDRPLVVQELRMMVSNSGLVVEGEGSWLPQSQTGGMKKGQLQGQQP